MNNDVDYLGFSESRSEYLETYIFEKQEIEPGNSVYKIKSWMNFITWCWWSWKTTFIWEIVKNLKKNDEKWKKCKYLNWKKDIIVIRFDPWNFQSTESIYKHFFDTFISWLLQVKYDSKIKWYWKDFVKILENSWNTYLKVLSNIFYNWNDTIESLISKLNKSLITSYSDYMILVVIDELDRIEKEDLLNVWKILNLIKNLIKENKQSNLFCIYSADSNHLLNYYLWDNKWESTAINLYQYYRKFTDSTYDVYSNSKNWLISYMANGISNFYISLNPTYAYEINKTEIYNRCKTLFDSLNEKNISIPIRDLIFYLNDLGRSQKGLIEKIKYKFWKSYYEKVLDWKTVEKYVWEIITGNSNIGLDFINIKSIYEKDFSIITRLDKIHSLFQNTTPDTDKFKVINNFCNNQPFIVPNFVYKYLVDDEMKNLIEFVENDYFLIRWMIEKNNLDFRYDYIINKFEDEFWNDLLNKYFEDIQNKDEKLHIIFYPRYNRRFQLYSENHFTKIIMNLNLINASWNEELQVFKNSVEIFKWYLLLIEGRSWDNIDNRDYWFIITVLIFFSKYFKDFSRNLNLFEYGWDGTKIIRWENYNEIKNCMLSFLKELVDIIKENNKISFIPLYFLVRLFRYSYFQYVEEKKPELSLIVWNCIEELWEIGGNPWDLHLLKQWDSLYKIWKFVVLLLNYYLENNNLDIINSIELTLSNLPESERTDLGKEKISILEILIYSLLLNDTLFEDKFKSTNIFLSKFVPNRKYLFLLICYSLEYEYWFKDELNIRMSFPNDLFTLYKKIYTELINDYKLESLVDDCFYDIYLFSTEHFSVVPMNIKSILQKNKRLNEKKLKELLVDNLKRIYEKS